MTPAALQAVSRFDEHGFGVSTAPADPDADARDSSARSRHHDAEADIDAEQSLVVRTPPDVGVRANSSADMRAALPPFSPFRGQTGGTDLHTPSVPSTHTSSQDTITKPDGTDRVGLERSQRVAPRRARAAPVVDIIVPVHNEQAILAASVERLHRYLAAGFPFPWRITIVDNASTDATWDIAGGLAARFRRVRTVHVPRKGRGLALRSAWLGSDAEVLVYTDVDLSTDLDALLPLVAPLVSGHSEVATGSRLTAGAVVARGPKRELISRTYNVLLRLVFATRFRDAQCGFKAIRADVARQLIPEVADNSWFFDTELLLLAEHNGLRVHEVPVDWIDDPDTRVHVGRTIVDDLRGMARMAWRFMRGGGRVEIARAPGRTVADDLGRRLVSFMTIGAVSTAVSLGLFLLLRNPVGAIAANAIAVTATFVANTWANRHWTLGGRVRRHHWWGALGVYAASVAVTSIALAAVHAAGGGLVAEILTLAVTWTMATIGRLGLIRSWSLADNRPHASTSQLSSVV